MQLETLKFESTRRECQGSRGHRGFSLILTKEKLRYKINIAIIYHHLLQTPFITYDICLLKDIFFLKSP